MKKLLPVGFNHPKKYRYRPVLKSLEGGKRQTAMLPGTADFIADKRKASWRKLIEILGIKTKKSALKAGWRMSKTGVKS